MREDVRIKAAELPPRPRRMSDEELSKIFGGCGANGDGCGQDKDCCSGKCMASQGGFGTLTGGGSGYCYPAYRY